MDWSTITRQLVAAAAEEDLGRAGDLTARLLPEPELPVTARLVAREAGVICGLALGPLVVEVFGERLDAELQFTPRAGDGAAVAAGTAVATVAGPLAAVLGVERTLLNFVARMSGVASLTRRYVAAAKAGNPDVEVLDTRKTLPGWRELDKFAVRSGGGINHRFGLHDAILIKDNHLAGTPDERLAHRLFELLGSADSRAKFVEVEVDRLAQLDAVCQVVGIGIVLLDNFTLDELREAVRRRDAAGLRGKLALEASGGVRLETIAAIAATGVERISVGALTHSAVGLDVGLDR